LRNALLEIFGEEKIVNKALALLNKSGEFSETNLSKTEKLISKKCKSIIKARVELSNMLKYSWIDEKILNDSDPEFFAYHSINSYFATRVSKDIPDTRKLAYKALLMRYLYGAFEVKFSPGYTRYITEKADLPSYIYPETIPPELTIVPSADLSRLSKMHVLFLGLDVIQDPPAFKKTLKQFKSNKSNIPVILLDEGNSFIDKSFVKSVLKNTGLKDSSFKAIENLAALKQAVLDKVMVPVSSAEGLRCIPLTAPVCNIYEELMIINRKLAEEGSQISRPGVLRSISPAARSLLRVPSMTATAEGLKRLEENLNKSGDAQLRELMAYIAGDELPGLEKEYFEDLKDMEAMVRDFLETEIKKDVPKWEDQGSYKQGDKVIAEPIEDALKKIAELGILGISVPEKYNGLGLKHYYTYRIVKELAYFWPSLAVTVGVNSSVMDSINKFGTESQKTKLLPELDSKGLGAIAITEANAGSDVMNMQTFARKDGNDYVLNGSKLFITSAGIAGAYIVFAVTDKGEAPGSKKKISAFLVNKDTPGFSIGAIEHKLGQKASPTGELIFENCRIPEGAMLGKPGEGMVVLYYMLTGGRIGIASLALGIARAAYDAASGYAEQRKQFGKPLGKFVQIEEKLANMKFYIDASELLIRYASYLKDPDSDAPQDMNAMVTAASMAKLFSTEKGKAVTLDALQIHGGYGYTKEYPAERYLRDITVTTVYEGASEIQQNIIKRYIPLFLNSETGIEKAIDSYFKAHPVISGHEQAIETIYETMNMAKEKLRKAVEEKKETHHDSNLLVNLIITRLTLFKAIFLANLENVSQESIEKHLNDALLASKFLRSALADYEIFAAPLKDKLVPSKTRQTL